MWIGRLSVGLTLLRRINIITGITLTLLVFCFLCCTSQRHHAPVFFVTNLLISNLLIICSFIFEELMPGNMGMAAIIYQFFTVIGFYSGLMNSAIFRMCIAVERYMIITRPVYTRGTVASGLACVGPWVFFFLILVVTIATEMPIIILLSFLLPIILSIIFVVLTFAALPAATSVDIEEKRRTVGVLVLLLVDYFLLIIPAFILYIYFWESVAMCQFLVLFTVFVDLALAVLMFKGPVDKFLAHLCCCMMDNVTTDDRISPLVTDVGHRQV